MVLPRRWVEAGDVGHDFALLRTDAFDDLPTAHVRRDPLPERVALIGIENTLFRPERPRRQSARLEPPGAVPMLSVAADLKRGASGGPWSVTTPGGAPEIVSLTSVALRSRPGQLFGPMLSLASLRAAVGSLHGRANPDFIALDLAPGGTR